MRLPAILLSITVLSALSLAGSCRAQMAGMLGPPPKQIIVPDTPQNTQLVDAVRRGDHAAVQAALGQGASADTRVGWEGSPNFVPVALFAAQDLFDKRERLVPIFRLLIDNVTAPNAADDDTGRTLLMAAVDMDDLDSVRRLVEKGADVNARQKRWPSGGSALLDAVTQGGVKDQTLSPIIACLLDHGAAVNVADENGATPLMQAAGMNKTGAVRALLARGADPAARDKRGLTALRWAFPRGWDDVINLLRDRTPMDLYEAAQFGDMSRLRAHLDAGEDPNAPDAQGEMPLLAAMKSGSGAAARLLLDRGADVNGKYPDGATALHLAALYGDVPLTTLLLDRGADINAVAHRQYEIVTPLTEAVTQAQAGVVALLIRHGVDLKRRQGVDALEVAVHEAGNGFLLHPRGTPPHRISHGNAVYDARERIIELLLDGGVDVRADHSRALFLAARDGQAGLIELLLNKGADVNARGPDTPEDTLEDTGQTALMGAIESGQGVLVDQRSMKNDSPSAQEREHVREEERFARRSVALLLSHGADVNRPDARGTTPLMQCISSDLPALPKMLLAHGAKVDAADPLGRTALMRAAAQGDRALAALLLGHGAGVNRRDKTGRTALMLAVDDGSDDEYRTYRTVRAREDYPGSPLPPITAKDLPNPSGHPEIVSLLLRHGAAVDAVAQDGATALSLARKQGFTPVAALLAQAGARR